MLVRSDRTYRFDASPDQFWAAVEDVGSYRRWWPWLRTFDGLAFAPGSRWTCAVQPPVPYRIRFTVDLDTVEPFRMVTVKVSGDILGTASLHVAADGAGSVVRLVSELMPNNRILRAAALVARPIVRFGHDWVLDTGASQFAASAL